MVLGGGLELGTPKMQTCAKYLHPSRGQALAAYQGSLNNSEIRAIIVGLGGTVPPLPVPPSIVAATATLNDQATEAILSAEISLPEDQDPAATLSWEITTKPEESQPVIHIAEDSKVIFDRAGDYHLTLTASNIHGSETAYIIVSVPQVATQVSIILP